MIGTQWLNKYVLAVALLIAIVEAVAFAAQAPTFSATASGTTNNLTLTASVSIGDADLGWRGNVYLAAHTGSEWLAHNGVNWVSWNGGPLPVYSFGPLTNRSIVVVRNADLSAYGGTQVYVGYGRNEGDMLANGKYGLVYTVPATPVVPVTYMPGTSCPVMSNFQCSQWIANGGACSYQSCSCYFNTPGVGADQSAYWRTRDAAGQVNGTLDCKLDVGLSSQQISAGSCSLQFSSRVKSFIDSKSCTPPAITITSATCNTQTVKITGTATLVAGAQLKDNSADLFLGLKCESWPFICRRESGEPATSNWTGEGGVNVADGVTLSFGVRVAGSDSVTSTVTCRR